jgi:uncharacterized damage-inducible protein DinB
MKENGMSIAHAMLTEFEMQAPLTRKFIERLPADKLTWKPHERSLTAGQLALHLALVPAGIARAAQNNPAPAPKSFNFPQPASHEEILKKFDEGAATVRGILPTFSDAAMEEIWRMEVDGRELFAQPRVEFLRNVMLSHWYQHRGQFSVYLRMLNVAVPATWGPSGDEPPVFVQSTREFASA